METRLRRSTKQNQYRITDDSSDDDESSVEKAKPPSSKKSYGGVLAVLSDNGPKKNNKTVNGKTSASVPKSKNSMLKKMTPIKKGASIPSKVPKPTCTPPTSVNRPKSRIGSAVREAGGESESTPNKLFEGETIKVRKSTLSATAAGVGMTPPPKSVLIATLPSLCMSPPTPGHCSTARVVSKELDDGDDACGWNDVSAMSCSVASPVPSSRGQTKQKFQDKNCSKQSSPWESPASQYRSDDEVQVNPVNVVGDNGVDDDATIPIEGQSFLAESQGNDETYQDDEEEEKDLDSNFDSGSDEDDDASDDGDNSSGTENEVDSEDEIEEETFSSECESEDDYEEDEDEYVPEDEDSASDDELEFDEEEKPAARKTRRATKQNKTKPSEPRKEIDEDHEPSTTGSILEPQDDGGPLFFPESPIASPCKQEAADDVAPEDESSLHGEFPQSEYPKRNIFEAISSEITNSESSAINSITIKEQSKETRRLNGKEAQKGSVDNGEKHVIPKNHFSPTVVEDEVTINMDVTCNSPEPQMAVVLDDDEDEDDDCIVEAIVLDETSQCDSSGSNLVQELSDIESVDQNSQNDESESPVNESMFTVEDIADGIVGMVIAPTQDNLISPEKTEAMLSSTLSKQETQTKKYAPGDSDKSIDSGNASDACEDDDDDDDDDDYEELARTVEKRVATIVACEKESQNMKSQDEDDLPAESIEFLSTPAKASTPNKRERFYRGEGIVKRGKWTLGSKIGVGSFGVVHIGMNTATGTLMAVKTFNMEPTIMDDVRREIELMRSLDHVNIVRYYGAQRDKKRLHIFQEWVPAGSVATMLNKFGPFGLCVIRRYLSQTLSGLAYLHENNIMHRDIKGSNILVNDEGIVKLADFGASKKLAEFQYDLMMSLTVRGTPYFMAPEVFEEKYSAKADIWGVGCVAAQMTTGSPPWHDMGFTNPISLFNHLKNHDGPPKMNIPKHAYPSSNDEHINSLFEKFVQKCFQKEPSNRPSAKQLLGDPFFIEMHGVSEDEQTPRRGIFSPESDASVSFWSPEGAAKASSTPTPSPLTLQRSKSVVQWKATFLSPPLPKKRSNRQSPSPCRKYGSPMALNQNVDTSEWPQWAKDRRKSLLEKENGTIRKESPQDISNLMGSLALSEDTEHSRQNANPFRSSSESSNLNGLKFVEGSSVLERSNLKYEL